jgi:glycosyltransferase involved in cell wall biosynthesis
VKIAILGTRGIPNNYGGFEQFAEYISVGLVNKGHDVTVYNPAFHPYECSEFKGVKIIKISSPEEKIGSAGNFIYDYNCLRDAARRGFDIIYEAGYATCSPFFYLLNQTGSRLVTNMDGLEWKRSKWNFVTRKIMKYLESLAVKKSQYLISDNRGIQEYYEKKYNKKSFFISYGADITTEHDKQYLKEFDISKEDYFLLIARIEPENSIELVLEAYQQSGRSEAFLIIGNYKTKYGSYLCDRFNQANVKFCGGVYNRPALDSLRFYCKAYLHGHSVGGTNPSLLEAMASSCFIIAHENSFNRSVLKSNAFYFNSVESLKDIFNGIDGHISAVKKNYINNNIREIKENYSWHSIIGKHEEVFKTILLESKHS